MGILPVALILSGSVEALFRRLDVEKFQSQLLIVGLGCSVALVVTLWELLHSSYGFCKGGNLLFQFFPQDKEEPTTFSQ